TPARLPSRASRNDAPGPLAPRAGPHRKRPRRAPRSRGRTPQMLRRCAPRSRGRAPQIFHARNARMRKQRVITVSLLVLVGALAGVVLLPQKSAHAQVVGGPLPPVPTPPNIIPLEPVEQLGKDMLYDNTMSDPVGYACAQCHAPTTGLTSGLESVVNLRGGPQPGVVPGRFGPRKPQSYGYA